MEVCDGLTLRLKLYSKSPLCQFGYRKPGTGEFEYRKSSCFMLVGYRRFRMDKVVVELANFKF